MLDAPTPSHTKIQYKEPLPIYNAFSDPEKNLTTHAFLLDFSDSDTASAFGEEIPAQKIDCQRDFFIARNGSRNHTAHSLTLSIQNGETVAFNFLRNTKRNSER